MLAIYLSVLFVLVIYGLWLVSDSSKYYDEDNVGAYILCSIAWPLVLAAGAVFAPFYGLFKLFQWIREFKNI